jgi:uncharacterized protein (DUF2225 family)
MNDKSPIFTRNMTCPACSSSFSTTNVRISYPKTYEISTDYCVTYQDEENSPYLYYVNVCNICGYAFTKNSLPLTRDSIKTIQEKISINWVPRSFGNKRSLEEAITVYKLAVYTSIIKNEKFYLLAGLLLRLGWLYRKGNNIEQEERFIRRAFEMYKKSYDIADYIGSDMSEIRILYLIGELARRLNEYEPSIFYFSKVISHPNGHFEKGIVEKAREQWHAAREEAKMVQIEG